jgi:hypothetical protein
MLRLDLHGGAAFDNHPQPLLQRRGVGDSGLSRGFWLCVWKIKGLDATYVYVGRTGDSSSPHAQSPFNRIGQHLDSRENAKGNALRKQLTRVGVNCECCEFDMVAVGPLFPEQGSMDAHRPVRDTMGALESGLAVYLRDRGYRVIGTHGSRQAPNGDLFGEVCSVVDSSFPRIGFPTGGHRR